MYFSQIHYFRFTTFIPFCKSISFFSIFPYPFIFKLFIYITISFLTQNNAPYSLIIGVKIKYTNLTILLIQFLLLFQSHYIQNCHYLIFLTLFLQIFLLVIVLLIILLNYKLILFYLLFLLYCLVL